MPHETKMNRSTAVRGLLAAMVALCSAHAAVAQQSNASFARAIANHSTSPSYVLITVIDDRSGSRQTVCTMAPFLLGAIQRQYRLPYTPTGEAKIEAIALAGKDHVYHFSRPDALSNLRPNYTPQILAQVQSRLKTVSTPDLVKGLSDRGGLRDLYNKSKNRSAYRDAVAYVLLQRGLSPIQTDMTRDLFVPR